MFSCLRVCECVCNCKTFVVREFKKVGRNCVSENEREREREREREEEG